MAVITESGPGHYKTVVIDPPWPGPGSAPRFGKGGGVALIPYVTMTGFQISAMPVGRVAAPDGQLFLWATSRSVGDATLLCQSWGFGFAGLFVWKKKGLGLGRHVRNQCEFVVWGRRQGAPLVDPKECPRQVQDWPNPKAHSKKPDEAYDLFRRLGEGPRLDIFNRRPIDGFDRFGNEADAPLNLTASANG